MRCHRNSYDANGNLTSDGSTSFVYDAENRLVSASGAKTASLAYDPLGRLWQTGGGSAGTTRFVYDGDRLLEEYDGAGTRLRAYAHGVGADEPLVWYEMTGGAIRRFIHTDNQGSVVLIAAEDGTAIAANGYDPWGIPNVTNIGRFQFTGQTWIPELGMYYYKARFYSPTLGRFMQTDPIGYDDQLNLYAYVGNDPVNHTDPLGSERVFVPPPPPPCLADACVTGRRSTPAPPQLDGSFKLGVIAVGGNRDSGLVRRARGGQDESTATKICEYAMKHSGTEGADLVMTIIGGILGGAVSEGTKADVTANVKQKLNRFGKVKGGIFRRGRSTLNGARAGKVGGAVGIAAGAVAGYLFEQELDELIDKLCGSDGS